MPPTNKMQLDFDFLAREARVIASDVAIENNIDLTSEAQPGVDDLIEANRQDIERRWTDIETWRRHVRHISVEVARIFKQYNVRQIKTREELVEASTPVIHVYPYD